MGVVNTLLVFTVYSMNFLLFIGALMTIYVCLSEQRQKEIAENIDIDFEFYALFSRILLGVALIVAIVSFLGCFGIAIDNDYMLIAYVVILGVLMIVKVLLSVYLSNNIDATPEIAKNKTLTLIRHYNESSSSPMDIIQKKYNCCGYFGYQDWKVIYPKDDKQADSKDMPLAPSSCCNKSSGSSCTTGDIIKIPKKGCNSVILDKVGNMFKLVYRIIFLVFGLEILLVVCSVLILLDIGQKAGDETSDEIVYVGRLKHIPSSKNDNVQFEESIDTHDSHLNQPPPDPHTVMREEELIGLYDEDKQLHEEEYHEDETQEDDAHEEENHEEEEEDVHAEQSDDDQDAEKYEEENRVKKRSRKAKS